MQSHEFILGKIAEEANEVASAATVIVQAAHKALRFGARSYHPDDPSRASNMATMSIGFERLLSEVNDLRAQFMAAAELSTLAEAMREEDYAQAVQVPSDPAAVREVRRALRKTSRYLGHSIVDKIVPAEEGRLTQTAYADALASVEEELTS